MPRRRHPAEPRLKQAAQGVREASSGLGCMGGRELRGARRWRVVGDPEIGSLCEAEGQKRTKPTARATGKSLKTVQPTNTSG